MVNDFVLHLILFIMHNDTHNKTMIESLHGKYMITMYNSYHALFFENQKSDKKTDVALASSWLSLFGYSEYNVNALCLTWYLLCDSNICSQSTEVPSPLRQASFLLLTLQSSCGCSASTSCVSSRHRPSRDTGLT